MTASVRSMKIALLDLEVLADIGFHQPEIGVPQRLIISVELWIDVARLPQADDPAQAWDYDFIRSTCIALVRSGRYNLQETLAQAIWNEVAMRPGVTAAAITVRKPDVYSDCASVGVTLSSAVPPA